MTASPAPAQRTEIAWPALIAAFGLPGRIQAAVPHGTGHINDTFAVTLVTEAGAVRHLFQRINDRVFRDVPALMENIARVTAHGQRRLAAAGVPNAARRALTLQLTTGGAPWWRDAAGGWWRAYVFVEGTDSHDVITHPGQAREAARAFGAFQCSLVDLPGGRLHETIPGFHDTRRRFERLRAAVAADVAGRATAVGPEIAFAFDRENMVDRLLALQARGVLPERVTHNDTKLNNVLLDHATGEGLCVIDLDTVMPGLVAYDFGDMVRSATNSAAEDETDLSRVEARLPIFEALAEGFLASAGPFLTAAERRELVFGGRLMTYEVGIRFLTDYLEGDVYFKTKRPGHNLDRARNQFALLRRLEHHAEAMEAVVRRFSPPVRILITGGAGFIGSHLAAFHCGQGATVRVLDNLRTGRRRNLDRLDVEFIEGSILDRAAVDSAMAGVDRVYHLAALVSVAESVADPAACAELNVTGLRVVLEAAAAAGVGKFVFASSAAVYGDNPAVPKDEAMPPEPQSPYAATKLEGERLCREFQESGRLETVALRFFNVFGPRQDPAGPYGAAVPIFLREALAGRPLLVHGDGGQTRDFVEVADIVGALDFVAARPGLTGVFNAGYGTQLTILELAQRIVALTGSPSHLKFAPARPGDVRHSRASVDRLRAAGWKPRGDLASGLARLVAAAHATTPP